MTAPVASVYDPRPCELGEGPLWHPIREQLFWFDIIGKRLLTRVGDAPQHWQFDEHVSAAGWIDRDQLLIGSETGLYQFNLVTGARENLCALEAENPLTRSNDGRADPFGGFWIGTMGKAAEPGKGAIYRYFKGELRCLYKPISISNSICFSPDGGRAHFTDTVTGQVMRVALDGAGWPAASPEVFLDLRREGLHPDGAVIDAAGTLWLAEWGAGRVSAYAQDGRRQRIVAVPAPHSTCPAFGGPGLATLFCTTALQGLEPRARAAHPLSGQTFAVPDVARGQYEHKVIL